MAALIRAADLHPSGEQRGRLLSQAAFVAAGVTGDLRGLPKLLADAQRADPEHRNSLQTAVAASFALLNGDGELLTAHRLLVGAIQAHLLAWKPAPVEAPSDQSRALDPALVDAVHSLISICSWAERADLWAPLLSTIKALHAELPRTVHLHVQVQGDPAHLTAKTAAEFDAAVRALSAEADPARTVQIAIAGMYIDRIDECRAPLWRVVGTAETVGPSTQPFAP